MPFYFNLEASVEGVPLLKPRALLGIFILIIIEIFLGENSVAADFSIRAKAAILLEPTTGKILYSQNADKRLAPASVTKVMTMLLVMEAVDSGRVHWNDKISTSATAAGMGGSQIYLKEGEELTLDEMFKAIAVVSANDASTAVAEYLYGSDEDFIAAMNEKTRELKLKNTHFANETGLPDPNHYSSAHDLAIISKELIKHTRIFKYTSIWIDKLRNGEFMLRNTNELIRVYRGADGLKTGHTDEAKFCLSATAKKEDFRLLSVILGAESNAMRIAQTKRLLDYGYRNYQWKLIHDSKSILGRVYIKKSSQEYVPVKLKNDLGVVVERGKDQQIETELKLLPKLTLPIEAGEKVGTVAATLNGKILAKASIYAVERVIKANFVVRIWRWFRDIFRNLFGKK